MVVNTAGYICEEGSKGKKQNETWKGEEGSESVRTKADTRRIEFSHQVNLLRRAQGKGRVCDDEEKQFFLEGLSGCAAVGLLDYMVVCTAPSPCSSYGTGKRLCSLSGSLQRDVGFLHSSLFFFFPPQPLQALLSQGPPWSFREDLLVLASSPHSPPMDRAGDGGPTRLQLPSGIR